MLNRRKTQLQNGGKGAKEATRRNYTIVNEALWPNVVDFAIEEDSTFQAHSVLQMMFKTTAKSELTTKPSSLGSLVGVHKKQVETECEGLEGKAYRDKEKEVKENLHRLITKSLEEARQRLEEAEKARNDDDM